MKQLFFIVSFSFFISTVLGQKINTNDFEHFSKSEDSLKTFAVRILQDISFEERKFSDSSFTKILVRTLKKNNSYYYPFRSLKLIPLFDKSNDIENPEDTISSNNCWIGAIYYKMIQSSFNDKKLYTLLGYNEFGMKSNKKIIEVLHFENGIPIFGGDYFNIPNNESENNNHARFLMEYKKNATPRLNFDEDLKMIIKEHLISETNEPDKKYSLIGDGDYEGFVWKNGKWEYVLKVFDTKTPNGKAPIPSPIRDNDGHLDNNKLKNN